MSEASLAGNSYDSWELAVDDGSRRKRGPTPRINRTFFGTESLTPIALASLLKFKVKPAYAVSGCAPVIHGRATTTSDT